MGICREKLGSRLETPMARQVIRKSQHEKQGQPYQPGAREDTGNSVVIVDFHKEKCDQRGFSGRDSKCQKYVWRPAHRHVGTHGGENEQGNQPDVNQEERSSLRSSDLIGHSATILTLGLGLSNEIQHWIEEHPHQIHKVPVQPDDFNGSMVAL